MTLRGHIWKHGSSWTISVTLSMYSTQLLGFAQVGAP